MSDLLKCSYVVLNYAPTVIGRSSVPCVVWVNKNGLEYSGIEIYISKHLNELVLEPHREYLSQMIIEFASRSNLDLDAIFLDAMNLSVGPLRVDFRGVCDEKNLHAVLREIFDSTDYFPIS